MIINAKRRETPKPVLHRALRIAAVQRAKRWTEKRQAFEALHPDADSVVIATVCFVFCFFVFWILWRLPRRYS